MMFPLPSKTWGGNTMYSARRIGGIALSLTLAISATALAGPLGGRTYEGRTRSSGVDSEGHSHRLSAAAGAITLRVSSNGRSVTVRFPSSHPLLYCNTTEQLHSQSTKAASISGGGTFKASINQRFSAGPGASAIVQVVSGRFSGGSVSGTVRTEAGECGGSTSFSARAN
jgi:hypothetical protein